MSILVESLRISDVKILRPTKHGDHRGFFSETFNKKELAEAGIKLDFVQDNQSLSAHRGTVRGIHFQLPPHPQTKLVRVLKGAIYDVAVDLRCGSPAFGKWCAATLTAEQGDQLLIPRGFAHAYCTLQPDTEVAYKVDDYYAPECEAGIIWNDPDLGIDWPIMVHDAILSDRDAKLPRLLAFNSPFSYRVRR